MDGRQGGQNLVEFALILPILLLLVFGVINFAYAFTVHTSLVHAAREGVRYGMVEPTDARGICDRVVSQVFLTTPELQRITVRYDDLPGFDFSCDEPLSGVDGDEIAAGDHRLSIAIEHDLPALTPIIRAVFHIDVVARRTITSRGMES